ncbi:hypothetical protein V5D56_10495 [Cellulosimicrobium sp. PMB13]|uniref:hypothetical protein n=1 Tax=Cellulosimicrobium sp. PMB13 TaxID=3120158 RepID=UPI003F4BE675
MRRDRSEAAVEPVATRLPEGRGRAPGTHGPGGGAGLPRPSFLTLQRTAGNAAVQRLRVLAAAPGHGSVQRVVSLSTTFVPQAAAIAAINLLDAEVTPAEQDAARAIRNRAGGKHTMRQAHYLFQPSPRSWGSCVEEQLDPRARVLGWGTQFGLSGARPDYHRVLGAATVFADLTTATQSNPGGNHITTKLVVAAFPNKTGWQAADVIHSGIRPGGGQPPPVQTNGLVSAEHARRFQQYHAYLPDRGYDPLLEQLRRHYGPVSTVTFTQAWDAADRDEFVDAFQDSVSEEPSESIASDDEF